MNREDLKNLFKILIIVLLIIVGVKFFIALFPLILLGLLIYFIYDFYKKTKDKTTEKINVSRNNSSTNKKKHHVQEAEIVREKNED